MLLAAHVLKLLQVRPPYGKEVVNPGVRLSGEQEGWQTTHGGCFICVVSGGQDEAGLCVAHPGPREVGVLEAGALDVDDPLRPHGHLQDHLHGRVQLHRR